MQKTGKWSDTSARAIPDVVFWMGALLQSTVLIMHMSLICHWHTQARQAEKSGHFMIRSCFHFVLHVCIKLCHVLSAVI